MKLENEQDFKFAENLINSFKKASLTGFTGLEAFTLIKSLEWLVVGMSDFKKPTPSPQDPTKITPITSAKNKKNK